MNKIITLLLAAGLVFGVSAAASAADIKVKGSYEFNFQMGDASFLKHDGADNFVADQRVRTQIDFIASETLKGVYFLEIGVQTWGKGGSSGASLGTDGTIIKTRYAYIDWVIPKTELKVRMGLQNFALPQFSSPGNAILGGGTADGAGVALSTQFTDNVGGTLFWLRAENDNAPSNKDYHFSDAMDFLAATLPMTFEGVKATPWAMYGALGRDAFNYNSGGQWNHIMTGLLPMGGASRMNRSVNDDRHGNAWWIGFGGELKLLSPFRFAVDAAYGSVDLGSVDAFDITRSGWYGSLLAEYKLDFMTPGLVFWYASGDDSNPNNGSERLPTVRAAWNLTTYGFNGNFYNASCDLLGWGIDGKLGVYGYLKDISFMDDMKHVLRVGYVKGTNDTNMARHFVKNDTLGVYMTTSDAAWEVNFDTAYNIDTNLQMVLELGYIHLDMDKGLWGSRDQYDDNAIRGAVTLKYSF